MFIWRLRKSPSNGYCAGLENDGLEAVASGLLAVAAASQVELLDLSANDLEDEEASQVMATLIRRLPKLRTMKLQDNMLGNKGGRVIAQALDERFESPDVDSCIEVIDLSCTLLYTSAAKAITTAAARYESLQSLKLDGNYITEDGIEELRLLVDQGACASTALGDFEENDEEEAAEESTNSEDDGEPVEFTWEPRSLDELEAA